MTKTRRVLKPFWKKTFKRAKMTFFAILIVLSFILPVYALFSDQGVFNKMFQSGELSISLEGLKVEMADVIDNDDSNDLYNEDLNNTFTNTTYFGTGDVNTIKFDIKNTGKSAVKVESKLKIAWDDSNDLKEANFIYLYPATMSDTEIREDIVDNSSNNAIINYNLSDQTNLTMNNGESRKGFSYNIPTYYLDSNLSDGVTTSLSNGKIESNFEYKIVFGVRPGIGQSLEEFEVFEDENLKFDIEVKATDVNINSKWDDEVEATVLLEDAQIDYSNPIFGMYDNTPPELTLVGGDRVEVVKGGTYKEKGYYAVDDTDGDITSNVVVTGTVNMDVTGEYVLTYTVEDASGNEVTKTRTVVVVTGETADFAYSGSCEEYIVPQTGNYKLETWGAEGGGKNTLLPGYTLASNVGPGGKGGYSEGEVVLAKGEILYICVGGQGLGGYNGSLIDGGFNGGGTSKGSSTTEPGGSGGGATDIRIGENSLYSRVIVAGGGAGGGEDATDNGGAGGGTSGTQGKNTASLSGGLPGTQTSAGTNGSFGNGANIINADGGAGGGGWFGGGIRDNTTDTTNTDMYGGGGGSGFIYTTSTAQYTDSSIIGDTYLLDSNYYLENAETIAGNQIIPTPEGGTDTGRSGNGFARLTLLEEIAEEITFENKNQCEEYVVPITAKYSLETWGAEGGGKTTLLPGYTLASNIGQGGKGGYSKGEVTLTKGETLYICVGGQGLGGYNGSLIDGGFNGGGTSKGSSTIEPGSSGGGATDIRIGENSLYSRVIVAGGGAGGGEDTTDGGGAGGGVSGTQGMNSVSASGGLPGTQTSAGTNGSFGNGANIINADGGAGGGGWFGGGIRDTADTSGVDMYGGGGGSGFIYTTSTAQYTDSSIIGDTYLLDSNYYLENAETIAGNQVIPTPEGGTDTGRSGNGYARIKIIFEKKDKTNYLDEVPTATSSSSFWGGSITRNKVESINFTTSNTIPTGVLGSWDAGLNKNGSVMAWYTDTDSNGMYEVVVGSVGGVYAPKNSENLFSEFLVLKSLDLNNLDTSKVKDMSFMFNETGFSNTSFTMDLGNSFDTSNVTTMTNMFNYTGYQSTTFTMDLGDKFDTSNVTDMSLMFYNLARSSKTFALDLEDKFNTINVTNMNSMFKYIGYIGTVFTLDLGDNFDTSNVTDMSEMFAYTGYGSPLFKLDLKDKFNTSNVTTMVNMFNYTGYRGTSFTLDLGDNFDTTNVTTMNRMFSNTGRTSTVFTLDLGTEFNTSKVTDMSYMFYSTGYSSPVFKLNLGTNFDTTNVTTMNRMFYYTGYSSLVFTLDLKDEFNTANVIDMSYMFNYTGYKNTSFTLDLGDNFDTTNVTNMANMFAYMGNSSTIFTLDLGSKFNTSKVTNMTYMFMYVGKANTSFTLDLGDNFDTTKVTNMNYMFGYMGNSSTTFTLDLGSKFNTTNVTNITAMFVYVGKSNPNFILDLRGLNFNKVTASNGDTFYTGNTSHKMYTDSGNNSFVTGKGFNGTIINCSTSSC